MKHKRFVTPAALYLSSTSARHSNSVSSGRAGNYEIKVGGHLDAHWSQWLGGLAINHDSEGDTLLIGFIPDQAALYGILLQIRDLGLPLLSLKRIETS